MEIPESLSWQQDVSIFAHPVILRDLLKAVGIPFGVLIVFLLWVSGWDLQGDVRFALGLIGLLFAVTWLLIFVLFRGIWQVEFHLNDRELVTRTGAGQVRRWTALNRMTVLGGLAAGRPGAAGAGLLAGSRQEVRLPWKKIRRMKVHRKSRTIVVRGGLTEKTALFCTLENFPVVLKYCLDRVPAPVRQQVEGEHL